MKTDYIHPRLDIVGPEYSNFIFGGSDRFKKLANKCLDVDKSCSTYFSGTGKILVMNCYGFKTLFISYIRFVTHNIILFVFW